MTISRDDDLHRDDEVMTISDVAQYLRISEAKVYELARNGSIPALRIGKAWRFQKDLLKQWLRKSAEANLEREERAEPVDKMSTRHRREP